MAAAFSIDVFESSLVGTTYLKNDVFIMDKYNKSGIFNVPYTVLARSLARPSGLIIAQQHKQEQGEYLASIDCARFNPVIAF